MLANWSLILNGLLLIIVVISIGRLMKARRAHFNPESRSSIKPAIRMKDESLFFDDIIAVRRIGAEEPTDFNNGQGALEPALAPIAAKKSATAEDTDEQSLVTNINTETKKETNRSTVETTSSSNAAPVANKTPQANQTIMMFLQAKENRLLAGYELLQTVLAAGLRFGEGSLFHRHQYSNGQGPVLCSLASATPKGTFDLQNIGAFSVRGLCLFMQSSGSAAIDSERFHIMLDTAKQLRDDLDTHLLDFHQRPLTDETVDKYYQLLDIPRCTESLAHN